MVGTGEKASNKFWWKRERKKTFSSFRSAPTIPLACNHLKFFWAVAWIDSLLSFFFFLSVGRPSHLDCVSFQTMNSKLRLWTFGMLGKLGIIKTWGKHNNFFQIFQRNPPKLSRIVCWFFYSHEYFIHQYNNIWKNDK